MISSKTLSVFEKIASETGISIRELIEEFNEPASKLDAEPAVSLERRLRTYFGSPAAPLTVAPVKTAQSLPTPHSAHSCLPTPNPPAYPAAL